MALTLDPRVRMRDALRDLVTEAPTRFDKPSLFVLRNRLLDRTGSDARPLAEFLIEASRRGWRDRLPNRALASSQFDATVAPFVLQWSTERFVQPEMARWAVESWAYALDVIDESQLRIAPPPRRESVAAMATRLNAGAARAGAQAADAARAVAKAMAAPAPTGQKRNAAAAVALPRVASPRPAGGRQSSASTLRSSSAYTRPYTATGRTTASGGSVPTWLPKALFGTLCVMAVALLVSVTVANVRGTDDTAVSPAPAAMPSMNVAAVDSTSGAAATSARTVAPSLTGGVNIVAPERPGVPSLTRGLLSTGADGARMVYVQPARRAAGDGRRMQTPSVNTPITFDELHFVDGAVMQGRVDVVRAGTIIFRDMRTGLRHEYSKDDIAELITEFGTVVRFRGDASAPVLRSAPRAARATVAAKPENSVRSKGVAGRYLVKYAAASAVGSPECTDVWRRPPDAEDVAVVAHIPGADTLSVAFERGDVFPSTVDRDGYFASTFRIVPDQARTMTALTTRLTGRFMPAGVLQVTVNIVFYRRLRAGEITCNVTVKAEGKRG